MLAGLSVCCNLPGLALLAIMYLLVDMEFMDNLDDSSSRRGPVGRSAGSHSRTPWVT